MTPKFEEGFNCLDCGMEGECEVLNHGSLDAYDDDPDAFCPECHGDNLNFHRPAEDR